MLAPSPVIKQTAKDALSRRFLTSVVVCSIFLFLLFAGVLSASTASFFAGDFGYLAILVPLIVFAIFPLILGVLCYFRRLIWEQKDSVLVVFKYFSNRAEYKRALRFSVLFFSKIALYAVVVFSPCIVIMLLSQEQVYKMLGVSLPIWASNLWTLNSFVAIISLIVLMFAMLRFYLSPFIFVSNDDIEPAEALNMSTIISKRTGGDFFGLVLSFAGWILLSCLVAPLIFTLPYFFCAYAVHCRFAITAYNLDVERFNAANTPFYSTDGL